MADKAASVPAAALDRSLITRGLTVLAARVSLPSTLMQAAVAGMQSVLKQVVEQGGIGGYADRLCGFGVVQRMVAST